MFLIFLLSIFFLFYFFRYRIKKKTCGSIVYQTPLTPFMYKVSIDWHRRGCKVQAWVTERSMVFKRPPVAVFRHFVLLAGKDEDDPLGAVPSGGGRRDPETAQFEGKTC